MKRKIRLVVYSFLVLALLLWATPVLAVPPLPHAFYGITLTITRDGTLAPAPIGTVVSAKINGEDAGSYTTTVVGKYGDVDTCDYLYVGSTTCTDGDTINFHVDSISTDDTFTFSAGSGPTLKNLALVITDQSITGEVVEPIPGGARDHVVDATDIADTTITVNTTGTVTITVKKYYSNPHPGVALPTNMVPKYIDIDIDVLVNIAWPMRVQQTYTNAEISGLNEDTLKMYYFKNNVWNQCSDTGVFPAINIIWAKMTQLELTGSPIAFGGAAAPAPELRGGGGGGGIPPGYTYLTEYITGDGTFIVNVVVQSADGMVKLTIPKGIKAVNDLGWPTRFIVMEKTEPADQPEPPADAHIVGETYTLSGLHGVNFDSPVAITLTYDESLIPEGVNKEDLVIAYYDEEADEWVELPSEVDTVNNTVTALISHFTIFALIVPPAPEPEPAPAAFSVTDLSIQPTEVQPKEAVTITVSVANTGGTEDSYSVVLMINGVKEVEKSATGVAAGSSQDVSFSVTKEEAGSYSVVVDGLSGSFTVAAPPVPAPAPPPPTPEVSAPLNWPLIGGIIAGVIVVIVLITLLVRRRAY